MFFFFCKLYGASRRNKNRKVSLSAVVTQVSMAGHSSTAKLFCFKPVWARLKLTGEALWQGRNR